MMMMKTKPAGAPAGSESGSGSAGAVARKNMRVLLVEDDAPTRVLVAALLKKCGYAVAEAANGKAALELVDAAEAKFDLVLTDMMMPEVRPRAAAPRAAPPPRQQRQPAGGGKG